MHIDHDCVTLAGPMAQSTHALPKTQEKRMNEYRFGIRRYFSKFVDCVFIINEVNLKSHMSPMMENDFLINI